MILIYIGVCGYDSASKTIDGMVRHDKEGHEPIWTRCEEGTMTETVVKVNILKKTGHDFEFFKKIKIPLVSGI